MMASILGAAPAIREPLLQYFVAPQSRDAVFTAFAGDRTLHVCRSLSDMEDMVDTLLGLHRPPGTVVLLRGREIAPGNRREIGWVPLDGGLLTKLSVIENILLPLTYHGDDGGVAVAAVERWSVTLGVDDGVLATLTGGGNVAALDPVQRWIAGVLRAVMTEPKVLVVERGITERRYAAMNRLWQGFAVAYLQAVPQAAIIELAVDDERAAFEPGRQ